MLRKAATDGPRIPTTVGIAICPGDYVDESMNVSLVAGHYLQADRTLFAAPLNDIRPWDGLKL